jgi:hypothetical protein
LQPHATPGGALGQPMDPGLTYALIGLAGTIGAAVIGLFGPSLLRRYRNRREPANESDPLAGSIEDPKPGTSLEPTFRCAGRVRGYRRGQALWLVVERGGLFWPKESRIVPNAETGGWEATVFEDGPGKPFDLSLYATAPSADELFRSWLDAGRATGSYPGLVSKAGMRRLDRVDRLVMAAG